jgi:hypothetical protein
MPHLDKPLGERGVGEANPFAKPFMQAVGHLLGCSLRVGEAKD